MQNATPSIATPGNALLVGRGACCGSGLPWPDGEQSLTGLALAIGLGLTAAAVLLPLAFNAGLAISEILVTPALSVGLAIVAATIPGGGWRGRSLLTRAALALAIFALTMATSPGLYVRDVAQNLWGLNYKPPHVLDVESR